MFRPPDQKQQSARDAFTSLYNRSFDRVYGFIYARIGDAGAAEEIIQETYAAVWASIGGFQSRSQDTTWIVGIARHKLADHYRRALRRGRHEDGPEALNTLPDDADMEAIVINDETRTTVAHALGELSPLYRYALIMKYMDECTFKEIARVLGRSPKAVDGILQRAKAAFIRNYQAASGGKTSHG